EKNDSKEFGGKLKVMDDLIEVKTPGLAPVGGKSEYYVPGEQPAAKQEAAPQGAVPYIPQNQ
nr:hypothetical protein [Bacteroidota bacterium]